MEEYTSNLTEKINQLDKFSLNSEQKEIDKLLVRKEKELNIEREKWQQALKRNTRIYYTVIVMVAILVLAFIAFFVLYEKKRLKQTILTKNGVFIVLQEMQEKIRELKSTNKPKYLFTKPYKSVNYKGKKYLKILNTDFMELPSQPKYRYLKLK